MFRGFSNGAVRRRGRDIRTAAQRRSIVNSVNRANRSGNRSAGNSAG